MLGGTSSRPHYSVSSVVAWRRGSRKGGGELTEGDESSFNSPSHLLPPPRNQVDYWSNCLLLKLTRLGLLLN